jgi:hypothetical protein
MSPAQARVVVAAARGSQPQIRRQEKPTVPRPRSSPAASHPLPTLLRRYRDVHRRYVELERDLADLDRQILASGRPGARARRRAAEPTPVSDELRAVLRVLQAAEAPLPPREVASRLDITPKTASRRIARALHLGYVERAGQARYRVADAVPSL